MQIPNTRLIPRFIMAAALALSLLVIAGSTPSTPASAAVSDGWVNVDVGDRHTCGVTTVGEAFCWGTGSEGQLGDGTVDTLLSQTVPLEVPAPAGVLFASVDVGDAHSCALTRGGDIYCWGIGSNGQIGNGDVPPADFNPDPQLVVRPAGVTWSAVSAGAGRTCALTTDGDVYCWGQNDLGQLGVGDTTDRPTPALVPRQEGGVAWTSIDAGVSSANNFGGRLTCGVVSGGSAYCWGDDSENELGNGGGSVAVSSPSLVAGGISWTVVRAGLHHACGVSTTGALWCWGDNRAKQLGLGDLAADNSAEPQLVDAPAGVEFVDVVPGDFQTCALSADGDAYCWGSEDFNFVLGDGNETTDSAASPQLVVPPSGVAAGGIDYVSIDVGPSRVCVVDTDATGWCWGADGAGALGDDDPPLNKALPSQIGDRVDGPQDMTFGELRDRALTEPPFGLIARTTSGLPVEFTAIGGCSVASAVVTLESAGICQITASQPGDADWDAAKPITRQFTIVDASPTQQFSAGFIPTVVNPGGASTVTFSLAHPLGTVTAENVNFTATFGSLTVVGLSGNTCTTGTTTLTPIGGTLTYVDGTLEIGDACTISVDVTAPATAPSYPTSYAVSGGRLFSDLGESVLIASPSLRVEEGSGLEQTISMPGLSSWPITNGARTISATATSGLAVTFTAAGVCSLVGDELSFSGLGQCQVTADQAGNGTYAAAPTIFRNFNVVKAFQTIDFAPLADWPLTAGDRTVSATASSGLPVSFDATGDCTVVGDVVTPTAIGTCVVTANQFGDDDHLPALSIVQSFDIVAGDQTIDFPALDDWGLLDGARTLTATATSGLTVVYTTSGPCSVAGSQLSVTAVGTCEVTATQPGNGAVGAAPDVVRSFEVLKAGQSIDFAFLGEWSVSDTTRPLTATATSGLPVSFSTTGPCSASGSELTISGVGLCAVTASQPGDDSYEPAVDVVRAFQIVAAGQAITFDPLADVAFGTAVALTATSTSGLTVGFTATGVCTVAGTAVTLTDVGTCVITAAQPGDASYTAAADVVRSFDVTKAVPTVTAGAPSTPVAAGAAATLTASVEGEPGLPKPTGTVRFVANNEPVGEATVVDGLATLIVSDLPIGSLELVAQYLGDDRYEAANSTRLVLVTIVNAPLSLSGLPATVMAGDSVSVVASGFDPAEVVTFVFNSDPVTVGTATSSATGVALLTFAIPSVDPGSHSLTATGTDSALVARADTVLAAAVTTTVTPTTVTPTTVTPTTPATPATTGAPGPDVGTTLPETGSDSRSLLSIALLALAIGAAAVFASRRRMSARPTVTISRG